MAELNARQREAVLAVLGEHGGGTFVAERDDEHDEHAFVTFYVEDGTRQFEWIVEGDGTICNGEEG